MRQLVTHTHIPTKTSTADKNIIDELQKYEIFFLHHKINFLLLPN